MGTSKEKADAEGKWFYTIKPGHYGLTQKGQDLYNQIIDSTNSGYLANQEVIMQKKKEASDAKKAEKDALNARLSDTSNVDLTDAEFESLYDKQSVSLAPLASNPATPARFLVFLFFEYPDLVAKNPGWILTKMSLSMPEIDNVKRFGWRSFRKFVTNINEIDIDDIQFFIDVSGHSGWVETSLYRIFSNAKNVIDHERLASLDLSSAIDNIRRLVGEILDS